MKKMKLNVESNTWNRPSNKIKSTNYHLGHKKNEKEIDARLSLCYKYAEENNVLELKKVLVELRELGQKIKNENMQDEEISQYLKQEHNKYLKKLNIIKYKTEHED